MSELKRQLLSRTAAAVVPVGIAAAVVFAVPVARAAPAASDTGITLSAMIQPVASAWPAVGRHREASRLRAYYWAAGQVGRPYVWGGTGPGYDCSGLVMMAYRHAGIYLPRTTYEMLGSRLLVRVWHPRMGDLAFYGSGHVELFRRWGFTFGAHDYGSPVGLIHYGWGWRPTAFYRIR